MNLRRFGRGPASRQDVHLSWGAAHSKFRSHLQEHPDAWALSYREQSLDTNMNRVFSRPNRRRAAKPHKGAHMRNRWLRNSAILGIAVITCGSFLPSTAGASPAVDKPLTVADNLRTCLKDGYLAGALQQVYSPVTKQIYSLYCGTPDSSSGLLHLNVAHPVPLSQVDNFELCLQRMIGSGTPGGPADSGTTRWNWPGSPPNSKVGGFTQNSSRVINTVFTPGSNSSNWASCAA